MGLCEPNEKTPPQSLSENLAAQKPHEHNAKPLAATDFSEEDRRLFASRSNPLPCGCVEWKTKNPTFTVRQINYPARRVALCLRIGAVPKGVQVSDTCGNRMCVNPEHLRLKIFPPDYHKKWRLKNRKRIDAVIKEWRKRNPDKVRRYRISQEKKHRSKIRIQKRIYQRNRRATDVLYKLRHLLRSRCREAVLKIKKKREHDTVTILGCSLSEFKLHMESLFQSEMTWANHGQWEIDHVIPISIGKTVHEIESLCHYKNLQPLWKLDNRKKSNKMPTV